MEDFAGLSELVFDGVPMFSLPMGFLNSDDVEIMNEFKRARLFAFLLCSGSPSAVSRPLAFHEAEVIEAASQGSTRLVSLVTACCGGYGDGSEGAGPGEQPLTGRGKNGER